MLLAVLRAAPSVIVRLPSAIIAPIILLVIIHPPNQAVIAVGLGKEPLGRLGRLHAFCNPLGGAAGPRVQ